MDFASRAGGESVELAICCLAAPCNLAHENDEFSVEDRVNNAVVPHPHSIEVLFQVNAAPRSRLIAKRAHSLDYALSIIGGHSLQLFLDVPMELEGVGHV
jgi:hypothetical protein